MKRAVQNLNMKICRHCEESRVSGDFTSSERLANRLKINKTGAVGKSVKKNQMGGPNVGKVWKSLRVGQVVYTKLEEDAMLAGAGEEDDFIKCFDDITWKGAALEVSA